MKPGFGVGVKLNSADFQRGGFEFEDARQVVEWLNDKGLDFVELSGGNYESPAMQGNPQEGSTGEREAFFITFARDIAKVATMPIMVTGGITRLATAEAALAKDEQGFGVAIVGIARALASDPNLPKNWREGRNANVELPECGWKNRSLAGLAVMGLTKAQIERMAKGRKPGDGGSAAAALLADQVRAAGRARRYRKWRASV